MRNKKEIFHNQYFFAGFLQSAPITNGFQLKLSYKHRTKHLRGFSQCLRVTQSPGQFLGVVGGAWINPALRSAHHNDSERLRVGHRRPPPTAV